jgi:hypothetical protein
VSPINDGPITEADLDRLADYTAGLLAPQEERRVDELIRTDPAWRQAHQALVDAQPGLDAALAGLGPATIPEDVADRLAAAFAREAGPADPGTAKVIDISRRRRWTRLVAGTTAAAAAVAAIFAGVLALAPRETQKTSGGAGLAAPQPMAIAPPTVQHSGTDYTPQSLGGSGGGSKAAGSGVPDAARPAPQNAAGASEDLSRLNDPLALRTCLTAIVAAHGGTPSVADYARFEGRPALVVTLVGSGWRQVVVVGPQCGLAGTAEIYSTTQ